MLHLRSKYHLPSNGGVELRAFTHGLMPRTAPEMMQHFVADWRERGVDAWNEVPNHWLPDSGERVGWWMLPEYLGDRFIAPLIGAEDGSCIMQPNVHWTMNCLFSDPERFRGGRVVVTNDAFPSLLQPLRGWSQTSAFRVDVVEPELEAVAAAVDATCRAVAISHVGFASGALWPDTEIASLAEQVHENDGLVIVDGYHAVGTMPIDVSALGIDVYAAGLLKEASGASGNTFVYVRPGLDISPLLTGWFGHEDPFEFDPDPDPSHQVRRRFLGGTTPVAPLYHAVEGVRILLDAGLAAVREDSLAKTEYCIERARLAGLEVFSPSRPERRSAMVILEIEAADLLSRYLKKYSIYTDSRLGQYLRLAPFVWNTLEEIEEAFEAIAGATQSGKYLNDVPDRSTGPVS